MESRWYIQLGLLFTYLIISNGFTYFHRVEWSVLLQCFCECKWTLSSKTQAMLSHFHCVLNYKPTWLMPAKFLKMNHIQYRYIENVRCTWRERHCVKREYSIPDYNSYESMRKNSNSIMFVFRHVRMIWVIYIYSCWNCGDCRTFMLAIIGTVYNSRYGEIGGAQSGLRGEGWYYFTWMARPFDPLTFRHRASFI